MATASQVLENFVFDDYGGGDDDDFHQASEDEEIDILDEVDEQKSTSSVSEPSSEPATSARHKISEPEILLQLKSGLLKVRLVRTYIYYMQCHSLFIPHIFSTLLYTKTGTASFQECDKLANSRSSAWDNFKIIVSTKNNSKIGKFIKHSKVYTRWQIISVLCFILGVARCKKCKIFIRCGGKTGTSVLSRHTASCSGSSATQAGSMLKYVSSGSKVPQAAKKQFTKAVALFCAQDMRPFEVRSHDYF